MRPVPTETFAAYLTCLAMHDIPMTLFEDYKKWLRYYLDFCGKYPVPNSDVERLRMFLEKLQAKKQTTEQRHAAHAISLFLDMQETNGREIPGKTISSKSSETMHMNEEAATYDGEMVRDDVFRTSSPLACLKSTGPQAEFMNGAVTPRTPCPPEVRRTSQYLEAGYQQKSCSQEWDTLIDALAAEIKVRYYSRKTLKTYAQWARQFQRFLKNKPPNKLDSADVKDFLTHLAVTCRVASSTQNQAFNSLLFLYRHALKKEFGELHDVPRAKKSLYVPVVLSREEIDRILAHLGYPFKLVVSILFGCGLRLFECLQLRVRDFNFDAGVLTVHGKGNKDRTVPIPQSIKAEQKAQMETVGKMHDLDAVLQTVSA